MEILGLKKDVIEFFKTKAYLNHANRAHQLIIHRELSKRFGEIEIHSEDRNYNHDIQFHLAFNEKGDFIPTVGDLYDKSDYLNKMATPLFMAFVQISDLGPYITDFWNKCTLMENRVMPEYIVNENVPDLLRESLSEVLDVCKAEQEFWLIPVEERQFKLNWLNEIREFSELEYTPTIEELLFGGLDIYNALRI